MMDLQDSRGNASYDYHGPLRGESFEQFLKILERFL